MPSPIVAVQAHVEHRRVSLKDVLRAVAVVHIPVKDEHSLSTSRLRVSKRAGRIT